MSRAETVARTNGTKASKASKPSKVGAAAEWADDRLDQEERPQGMKAEGGVPIAVAEGKRRAGEPAGRAG